MKTIAVLLALAFLTSCTSPMSEEEYNKRKKESEYHKEEPITYPGSESA